MIGQQQNMLQPLLWSKPFETMRDLLDRIEGYYGNCEYRISRVDLATHWSSPNWKPKLQDHSNFVTRLKAPDPIPARHDIEGTSAAGFVFGRNRRNNINNTVTATIYCLNQRAADLPQSFSPFESYTDYTGREKVWNTEFKVYSRTLRSRGVNSLEDLESKYKGLWVYLTTRCLTLRIPSDTDQTRSRWKLDPLWLDLQQAFGKGIESLKRNYRPSNRLTTEQRIKRAKSEAKGFVTSLTNWQKLSIEERKQEFFSRFDDECFSNETLRGYVEKKRFGESIRRIKREVRRKTMDYKVQRMKNAIVDYISSHDSLDKGLSESERIVVFWNAIGLEFFSDENVENFECQRDEIQKTSKRRGKGEDS